MTVEMPKPMNHEPEARGANWAHAGMLVMPAMQAVEENRPGSSYAVDWARGHEVNKSPGSSNRRLDFTV